MPTRARRRLLFVQPSLQPPGGGQGVAAWMLDALARDHDVTVLTCAPVDPARIDQFFGTALQQADFRVRPGLTRVFRALDRAPLPLALLRNALVQRLAQQLGRGYDLAVTANNETDFGRPGIQYVHYPWGLRPRPASDLRWYHVAPLLAAYYRLADALAACSAERLRDNVWLVNSRWTGQVVAGMYGVAPRVVYPPVTAEFPEIPWRARQDGFVCIGRIAPEKELDRVIDIVAGVRRAGLVARLHLVGTPGPPGYTRHIRRRAAAQRDWITLHEGLSRAALVQLVASQRYGIHGMREEHFGMAPAELTLGGCIVWVPRGGGQVEIVGEDPRLTYTGTADAVATIAAVLRDPDAQIALRTRLAGNRERFSAARFVHQIREIAAAFPDWPPAA
jgi:glycosyltransferase involved in cell wall biosynthesis